MQRNDIPLIEGSTFSSINTPDQMWEGAVDSERNNNGPPRVDDDQAGMAASSGSKTGPLLRNHPHHRGRGGGGGGGGKGGDGGDNIRHDKHDGSEVGKRFVDEALDTDILLGRKKLSYHHPGNHRFRALIGNRVRLYAEATTRIARSSVIKAVAEDIKENGHRFLRLDKGTNRWVRIRGREANAKIANALRDAMNHRINCKLMRSAVTAETSSQSRISMGGNEVPRLDPSTSTPAVEKAAAVAARTMAASRSSGGASRNSTSSSSNIIAPLPPSAPILRILAAAAAEGRLGESAIVLESLPPTQRLLSDEASIGATQIRSTSVAQISSNISQPVEGGGDCDATAPPPSLMITEAPVNTLTSLRPPPSSSPLETATGTTPPLIDVSDAQRQSCGLPTIPSSMADLATMIVAAQGGASNPEVAGQPSYMCPNMPVNGDIWLAHRQHHHHQHDDHPFAAAMSSLSLSSVSPTSQQQQQDEQPDDATAMMLRRRAAMDASTTAAELTAVFQLMNTPVGKSVATVHSW